jgi:hypothetical protein
MLRPIGALIGWDGAKKNWTIAIHIGAEVIKRPPGHFLSHDADDDVLREIAVSTARDDGYDLQPENVGIRR